MPVPVVVLLVLLLAPDAHLAFGLTFAAATIALAAHAAVRWRHRVSGAP